MALSQDRYETAIRDGKAFTAWSGKMTVPLSLGTSNQRILFTNPTGSNKNVFIQYLVADSVVSAMTMADVFLNPTTAATGTTITPVNMKIGDGTTSVVTMKCDISGTSTSGGTQIAGLGVPGTTRTLYPECRFMIPPGNSIGVNAAYPGLAINTQVGQFLAWWYEESIV